MKVKTTKKGEVQPAKPSVPKHGAASAAAAATPPVSEIETADTLRAKGWKLLTGVFITHERSDGGIWDDEILADPEGNLWIVSEWSQPCGRVIRSERKAILRDRAVSLIAQACIPDEFHRDFRECDVPLIRLETAIQESAACMMLLTESECLNRYGGSGDWLQAGINSMASRIGEELKAAFYAGEFRAAKNSNS